MKQLVAPLALTFCVAFTIYAEAAPGDLDASFNAGSILNGTACTTALQSDGKLIVGGSFTTVPGLVRHGIARLSHDGLGDPSFNPGQGANGDVRAMVLQPDGKVMVGGWFTQMNDVNRNGIARLNSDGSLDNSFDPGAGPDDFVLSVVLQPDGKALVGGYFTHFNNVPRNHVARLNTDGSVDTSFNPSINPDLVSCLLLQPDGKVLVGSYSGLVRLESTGALDASFNPGYSIVLALAMQPDGRVLVGGNYLSRLGANGAVDNTFRTSVDELVSSIALQPDGKVVVGGQFRVINGEIVNYLARLNADGSTDRSFQRPFQLFPPGVAHVAIEPQGTILVSAFFYSVAELGLRNLIRLNADGSLNRSLETGRGISGWVFDVKLQSDRKLLIAGYFGDINGARRGGIARLKHDGSLDDSFDPGLILNDEAFFVSSPAMYSMALQPDGKVLVGGAFTNIGGISRNNIARLNPDGSVDTSFNPGSGADYSVYRVLLQSDGKVLMSGGFEAVNRVTRHSLARLHSDGSLDQEFHPEVDGLPAVSLQHDGKILLGGYFTQVNGTFRKHIARLNSDGTLDTDFHSVELDGTIDTARALKSGKILITGWFSRVAGVSRNRIARLNNDGTLDPQFDPAGPDGRLDSGLVTIFSEHPDGKLLVWGQFTNFNGVARAGIALLNPDGTVDLRFETPSELLDSVHCAARQPDGKILIGGWFSAVGSLPSQSLVRVLAEPPGPIILTQPASQTNIAGSPAKFTVMAAGVPLISYQWYRDGFPLADRPHVSGATTATLVIRGARFQDSGMYSVMISNAFGSVNSDPALLTVVAPGKGR